MCKKCGKSHRLLPQDQIPFKHYSAEVIENVIDEDFEFTELDEEVYENYPCEATMERWKAWGERLVKNAEGHIRSAAQRILDLSYEFLGSAESLLKGIKQFVPIGWLPFVIKIMLETGGAGAIP